MSSLKLSPLQHVISAAGAVAITVALFAGTAANAQTRGQMTAELSTAPAQARFVAGSVIWNCNGTQCTGQRNGNRAATVCARLARETGALVRFENDGVAFDAAALERCNRAA